MGKKQENLVRIPSLGKSFNHSNLKDSFMHNRFFWATLFWYVPLLLSWVFMPPSFLSLSGAITLSIELLWSAMVLSSARILSEKFPYSLPASSTTLNVSHGNIQDLVNVYDELVECCQANPEYSPSLTSSYEALLEVGSLMNGRTSETKGEVDYVETRLELIQKIVSEIRKQNLQKKLAIEEQKDELINSLQGFDERTRMSSVLHLEENLKDLQSQSGQ